MRLKLIGLCSVCTLIFGCIWADVEDKKVNFQNLWKNTARKASQPKFKNIVNQATSNQPISKQKSQKETPNYIGYMPEENSVWTTEEEAEELAKQSQKSVKYNKNRASWRTKEEQERYEERKAWKSERNKKKNMVSGKDLKNLFNEPYQRTAEDQRISEERNARRIANNKVLEEDLGGIFGDLSEEEANFLINVKKVVSHDANLEDFKDFLRTFEWNIDVKDSFGDTALIIAIQNREDELMKCLIENGANVNLTSDNGDTPLNIAVAKNRLDIVDYMLENGAQINSADTVDGDTPLIMAVRGGFEDMTSHLIENGVDVNQKNKLGQTPLIIAVQQENDWIIGNLISNENINLDVQDNNGYTALMHAADSNNVEAVEKLVRAGADPTAALGIVQNKNKPKKDNVQTSNQHQKTRLKGAFAERAAMLEQLFKARDENQGQEIGNKKSNETAEKKSEEEKAKRDEIIRILKNPESLMGVVNANDKRTNEWALDLD